jgi:hypothetical protein
MPEIACTAMTWSWLMPVGHDPHFVDFSRARHWVDSQYGVGVGSCLAKSCPFDLQYLASIEN